MNYAGFTAPVLGWLQGVVYRSHGVGVFLRTGRDADRRPGRDVGRVPGRRAMGRRALPVQPARQPRHRADPDDGRRRPGRVRAAFGLLLTYVGVPSILYGDEIGLEGHDGLTTRRTMPWDQGGVGSRGAGLRPHARP